MTTSAWVLGVAVALTACATSASAPTPATPTAESASAPTSPSAASTPLPTRPPNAPASALDQKNGPSTPPAPPAPKPGVVFADSYVGKYSNELVDALTKDPAVAARLRTLLGDTFDDWSSRFQVVTPVRKVGSFVVAEGCVAHLCGGGQGSVIAIDIDANTIAAGLVTESKVDIRSETATTPQPLQDWARDF